jgi:hypothetical protein
MVKKRILIMATNLECLLYFRYSDAKHLTVMLHHNPERKLNFHLMIEQTDV